MPGRMVLAHFASYRVREGQKGHVTNEAALLERAKAYDPAALTELYDCYAQRMYAYLYRRVSDAALAEDLTGELWLRVLRAIQNEKAWRDSFIAWLYRIAHNLVANWHRDQSRRNIVSLEDIKLRIQRRNGPDQMAEQKEEKDQLLAAIRRLPPDRQQLLILKFAEGMSNTEIGEVMGRSEGAIKSLYHRTLLSLREMFDAEELS